MASSSKQIEPAKYGGYGQGTAPDAAQMRGGLLGKTFNSRCPPIVTPDTTIIAVCEPNNFQGNAGPEMDGWFFSDFYLFHHLFQGTTKTQHWLTCVNPRDLVDQYEEFVHGDPRSNDRRVVLDKMFANELKDVRVFAPNDLLKRFLSYVSEACKATKNIKRPILVLIFGHGEEGSFAITIGGAGKFSSCPRLYQQKFREAIHRHNPDANVALLTTSCFGGGWTQTNLLNITAMSGTNVKEQLISWPQSASMRRVCGSRYATGVAQALVRSELQSLDMESESEIRQSSTFAALEEMIHDILTKEIDVRESNDISFSAKDDMWDMEWRARTGFPLTTYLKKWEALRLISPGSSSGQSLSASVKFSDFIQLSIPEAEFRLKRLAYDYLKSHPGDDSAAKNHYIHGHCHAVLGGESLSPEEIEELAGALKYRLKRVMARATEYKDRLGINFPDCREVEVSSLMRQMKTTGEIEARHSDIRSMVFNARLFDAPQDHEGLPYVKGAAYLALVFLHSGWSRSQIEDGLAELIEVKEATSPLEVTMRTFRFWEMPELRGMVGTLSQNFRKRLRSQSPTKRKRQSLGGVGQGSSGERRSGETRR